MQNEQHLHKYHKYKKKYFNITRNLYANVNFMRTVEHVKSYPGNLEVSKGKMLFKIDTSMHNFGNIMYEEVKITKNNDGDKLPFLIPGCVKQGAAWIGYSPDKINLYRCLHVAHLFNEDGRIFVVVPIENIYAIHQVIHNNHTNGMRLQCEANLVIVRNAKKHDNVRIDNDKIIQMVDNSPIIKSEYACDVILEHHIMENINEFEHNAITEYQKVIDYFDKL